ncbi:MAG: hypothetical protein ACE15E_03595 [Acidobacteriota bacterium]
MRTRIFLVLALALMSPVPAAVRIVTPQDAPAPIRYAVGELRQAAERMTAPGVTVYLSARSASGEPAFAGVSVPSAPESFTLDATRPGTIVIHGSDAVGAMYGALEVAESWKAGEQPDVVARGGRLTRQPFLPIRGLNMFLTTQGFDDTGSWYWSDDFWTRFLDILAYSRINFLDLHGALDLNIEMPNLFPYLVKVPGYPEVGGAPEKVARNLARLQAIMRMCEQRGIRVGIMNYAAGAWIGERPACGLEEACRKQGLPFYSASLPKPPLPSLSGKRLEEYTAGATRILLQALPGLWMFGFRIGESGQGEEFFDRTYLQALKSAPPGLNVYTRTWIATPSLVKGLAARLGRPFYLEIKYNGEQLALPYQAVTGGRAYQPSGSYETYTIEPRNWEIIWQIRASGTHRLFPWADPDFARRTVRSCKFGGGAGFSIEPINAYSPQADYVHNGDPKYRLKSWVVEQQRLWYLVWGRTGYDPQIRDDLWLREMGLDHGPAARPLWEALVAASGIIPLIVSYHNQGLDHRHLAAEYENGNHSLTSRWTFSTGSRVVPFPGNIDNFLEVGTLDPTVMDDPRRYVASYLQNALSGRMGPYQAAERLESLAHRAVDSLRRADPLASEEPKSSCLKMNVRALAALGRYYAYKIRAATDLEFYYQTHFHGKLRSAWENMQKAVAHWDELSEVTDEHFGHVPELIRMANYRFRWRDEGRALGLDLARLDQLEEEYQSRPRKGERFIGHVPALQVRPGESVPIAINFSRPDDDARVDLLYRHESELSFTRQPLERLSTLDYAGTVPASAAKTGVLEYYFEAFGGISDPYGSSLDRRPVYRVYVSADRTAPDISYSEPRDPVRGPALAARIRVIDPSGLEHVRAYYKTTPSWASWLPVEMDQISAGEYEARLPVTPEGLLYFFEARDKAGNVTRFPDFQKVTPYFVVPSWDPATELTKR